MPWPVYLALKQLFPPGKRFPAFALVSVIGVAVGVCALLVVQTVMNGFSQEHRENIQRIYGHEIVRSVDFRPVYNYKKVIEKLRAVPGVAACSPFAEGQVMVKNGDIPALPFVRGIHLELENQVIPVKSLIVAGSLDDLDDDRVILGDRLAKTLGIRALGQTIDVYSPTMVDELHEDRVPLPVELEVCGIFRSGYVPADENTMIVSLRRMQELYNLGSGVHGIRVRLDDPARAVELLPALASAVPENLEVVPWMYVNFNFLEAIRFEKTMLFFLMFIITLVASFSIASTLFSSVVKRSREIGVLGALGGRPGQILLVFASQGVFIGIVGYAAGCGLAFLIVSCRDGIVSFINGLFGNGEMISQMYMFSAIPVHYNAWDFLLAALFTVATTTVAGLVPAIWAARRKPAEAMREA